MNGVGIIGTSTTLMGRFPQKYLGSLESETLSLCHRKRLGDLGPRSGADLMAAVTADAERRSPPLLSMASIAMGLHMSAVEQQFGRWLALGG
jgi:hypothetical protein